MTRGGKKHTDFNELEKKKGQCEESQKARESCHIREL